MVALQNALAMSGSSGYGAYSGANYVNPEVLQKAITEIFDELSGLTDGEFKAKLVALGVQTQYLTDDVLAQYQERVNQLADSTEAAEAKMRLIAAIKVEEILGDDYDAPTKDVATNALAKREKELKKAYLDLMTSDANTDKAKDAKEVLEYEGATGISQASRKGNEVYQYVLKGLQEYAGLKNWTAAEGNSVYGNDTNRSFVFRDENGELTESKSAEWVAEQIAAGRALAELAEAAGEAAISVEDISKWLSNLDKNASEATASGIRNLISEGNFNNLSKNELNAMSAEVGTDPEVIRTYLVNTLGLPDENTLMTIFGVDTLGEVSTKWLDAVAATNDNFAKVLEGLPPVLQQAFNKIPGINDLSLEAQNAIAGMLFDAVKAGNVEDAAGALTSLLTGIMSDPTVDANELSTVLVGIDWQTANVEELTGILEDAGINTTSFRDKLQELIDLMQEGANVGFDAAAEYYGKTSEIANNIKDGEEFISNEDAEYLKAAGINVEEFFIRTADGTWKLLGDAQEFYNIVNNSSLDVFKSNIEALRAEAGSISNLQNNYTQDTIQLQGYSEEYFDESKQNYNKEQIEAQIAYIKAVSNVDTSAWEVALETGSMTLDQLQAIQSTVEENAGAWGNLSSELAKNSQELQSHYDAVALSAKNMDELNQMLKNGEINVWAYDKALESVGLAEAEAYGLDPETFDSLSDSIKESGSAIEGLSDDLKDNEREANDVAKALLRYDKAVKSVVDNSKDWMKVLKSGNLQDQAEIMEDLETAYADMLDLDMGVLSDSFLRNAINLDLMTRAANGSEEAYNQLMQAVQNDIIAHCDLDKTAFDAAKLQLEAELEELNFAELEIGANLNTEGALQAMTDLVNAAGMTAEQATSYLASMGVDAEVVEDTTKKQDTNKVTGYNTTFTPVPTVAVYPSIFGPIAQYGWGLAEDIQPVEEILTDDKESTSFALKVTSANKSSGGNFKYKNTSNGSGIAKSNSSKGGGGSKSTPKEPSKPKKIDTTKKVDFVERFKELKDQLDDLSDEYEKASRSADRLWGEHRLDAIREQNKLIEEQQELLKEKQRQAENYMNQDRAALNKAAAEAGLSFSYDDEGNITNYTDQMTNLYNQLAAAEAHYNSHATGEEHEAYEETILDPLIDKI